MAARGAFTLAGCLGGSPWSRRRSYRGIGIEARNVMVVGKPGDKDGGIVAYQGT